MKLTTLTTVAGLALAVTAQAGEDYSDGGKAVIAPPAPSIWTWFAGGSVGYVTGEWDDSELGDWDEPIYTLHVGLERKCPGESCTHAFFLEVGYTENDVSGSIFISDEELDFQVDTEIIPITLNYKYECELSGKWNWYAGAGIGIALVDVEASVSDRDSTETESNDTSSLYGHLFAGVTYNVSETFELFAGARLIYMEDLDLDGADEESPLDGAAHYEIGGRYNF